MKIYAICYDLNSPGQDYKPLHDAIKEVGDGWWRYLDSTWLVHTSMSASQIWNTLKGTIDQNDSLLVIRVTNECDGRLPEQEAWDWLNRYGT